MPLSFSPNLLDPASNARAEIYDKFLHEASGCDRNFMKECGKNLNTTLIFVSIFRICIGRGVNFVFSGEQAGLFSTVAFAFITGVWGNSNQISNKGATDLSRLVPHLATFQPGSMPLSPQKSSSHLRPRLSRYLLEFGCLPRRVHRRVWQTITHSLRLD